MQLGVVDGDRRLRGDAGQHVQIVLLKPLPLVERVDLDHAQRLAVAVDQRCAHHRANAEVGDALAHARTARRWRRRPRGSPPCVSITWLTIVRLMRTWSSVSLRGDA